GVDANLLVEGELPLAIAQQLAGLARVGVGADEQVGPTIAIDVAPGGGVSSAAVEMGEEADLRPDVAEDEGRALVFGWSALRQGGEERQRREQHQQQSTDSHGDLPPRRQEEETTTDYTDDTERRQGSRRGRGTA